MIIFKSLLRRYESSGNSQDVLLDGLVVRSETCLNAEYVRNDRSQQQKEKSSIYDSAVQGLNPQPHERVALQTLKKILIIFLKLYF